VPIRRAGRNISILDLYGSRPVLIAGPGGHDWVAAADKQDVPIDAYRLGAEIASAYGIGDQGASVVRPDGFVAWRTRSAITDAVQTLRGVVRSMLFR
jgi:putative polyketide hydroxylase